MNDRTPSSVGAIIARNRVAVLLGLLLTGAFQVLLNRVDWSTRAAVDALFSAHPSVSVARRSVTVMVVLGLLAFVLRIAARQSFFRAGFAVVHQLRRGILEAVHRQVPAFFRQVSPASVMNLAIADTTNARFLTMHCFFHIANVVFAFGSALQIMARLSGRLTLAALSTMPVLALLSYLSSRRSLAASTGNQETIDRLSELAHRHYTSIKLVRTFSIEAYAEEEFARASESHRRSSLRLARIRGALVPALGVVHASGLLLVVLYGAFLLRQGRAAGGISEGDFMAFLIATARMAVPLNTTGFIVGTLQRGRSSLARIAALVQAPLPAPTGLLPADARVEPRGTGLSVRNLSYSIDGSALLSNVSFDVAKGESLAIVGRTGSGKSTLAMLVTRLLPTPRATVFIDGEDICDMARGSLRARVGFAQQDPFLFSTSVADNIGPDLDHRSDDLLRVLADVQIADEVRTLPDGVATIVGDRGMQLSGGQRQRIALGRALLSAPPLLVLDDPLSAVDASTEAAIMTALRARSVERSLVLVTTRMSMAGTCDRVIVLGGGRVLQTGTPLELRLRDGLFRSFADEQSLQLGSIDKAPAQAHQAVPTAPGSRKLPAPGAIDGDGMRGRPPQSEERERRGVRILARIIPYLVSQRGLLLGALALLAGIAVTTMLRPAAVGAISQAARLDRSLLSPGLCLAGILGCAQLFSFVQTYLAQLAGVRSMRELRMQLFRHSNRLGTRFFDQSPVGRLVTTVVFDVEAIGELFAGGAVSSVGDLVALTAILVAMLAVDWRLALVPLAATALIGAAVRVLSAITREAYRQVRVIGSQMATFFNEQVSGIVVTQAYGYEAVTLRRFDELSRAATRALSQSVLAEVLVDAVIDLVQALSLAGVLLLASGRDDFGGVDFAVVVMFQQYMRQFFDPLGALAQRATSIQFALASAERVFEFLDLPEEESSTSIATTAEAPSGEPVLSMQNVEFAYREGKNVLDDVSLMARRGERIALVGFTGAGKSTVAQLFLRLYDGDRGAVRVLGRDVREWERHALRRSFAVVPQEVMLFSGSLLDNIAIGERAPDRARAEHALENLGVKEYFMARLGGLDAKVDQRGLNFSAGERQLLAFARAMYRDAPILLLDEATATVDSTTEARLQAALDVLLVGRTSLIIAHRLSTIESADRIFVLAAGKVVESGNHSSLIASGGIYSAMRALQVADATGRPRENLL